MINIINLINNITRDITFIFKDSVYYSALANIIIVGILILINTYYFFVYFYNYYYQHEIYIRKDIRISLILNLIALIILIRTLYSANTEYINTKTKNIINQIKVDVNNLTYN